MRLLVCLAQAQLDSRRDAAQLQLQQSALHKTGRRSLILQKVSRAGPAPDGCYLAGQHVRYGKQPCLAEVEQWPAYDQQDKLAKSWSRPRVADITTKGVVMSHRHSQRSLMIERLGHKRCLEALHYPHTWASSVGGGQVAVAPAQVGCLLPVQGKGLITPVLIHLLQHWGALGCL